MDELMDRINRATGLNDLIPLIETLSRETETILCTQLLRDRDIERILVPIATIRILLSKLDLLLSGPEVASQAATIRNLAARCLDLEGTLKEARNDRHRAKYAA